jgi:hypothetical protein
VGDPVPGAMEEKDSRDHAGRMPNSPGTRLEIMSSVDLTFCKAYDVLQTLCGTLGLREQDCLCLHLIHSPFSPAWSKC